MVYILSESFFDGKNEEHNKILGVFADKKLAENEFDRQLSFWLEDNTYDHINLTNDYFYGYMDYDAPYYELSITRHKVI